MIALNKASSDVYDLVLRKHEDLAGLIVVIALVGVIALLTLCALVLWLRRSIQDVVNLLPEMQAVLTIAKEHQELNRRTLTQAGDTLKQVRDVERVAATHVARSAQTQEVVLRNTDEIKRDVKELKGEPPASQAPLAGG